MKRLRQSSRSSSSRRRKLQRDSMRSVPLRKRLHRKMLLLTLSSVRATAHGTQWTTSSRSGSVISQILCLPLVMSLYSASSLEPIPRSVTASQCATCLRRHSRARATSTTSARNGQRRESSSLTRQIPKILLSALTPSSLSVLKSVA